MTCWMRTIPFVSLFAVAACSSTPVEEHHYSLLLDALSDSSLVEPAGTDATLEVRLVTVPRYLQSNNLVMQVGDNEILPARRHFWAEPLDESIRRVLIYDMDRRLPDVAVRSTQADGGCSLAVAFERFHATNDARVVASGRYSLRFADGQIERKFDTSRVLQDGGYANSVSELRRTVNELAAELTAEIAGSVSCLPVDEGDLLEQAESPD